MQRDVIRISGPYEVAQNGLLHEEFDEGGLQQCGGRNGGALIKCVPEEGTGVVANKVDGVEIARLLDDVIKDIRRILRDLCSNAQIDIIDLGHYAAGRDLEMMDEVEARSIFSAQEVVNQCRMLR